MITDEILKPLEDIYVDELGFCKWSEVWTAIGEARRALEASHPSPSASEAQVRVKALEWTFSDDHNSRMGYANTEIGRYEVFQITLSYLSSGTKTIFGWKSHWTNGDQRTDSFDDALAAAQADYERRALSCLSTPEQGETEAPNYHEGQNYNCPCIHPSQCDDSCLPPPSPVQFAAAMKAKLAKKRDEGRGGWEDKEQCSNAFLSAIAQLNAIVDAWEALPGGRQVKNSDVEQWLAKHMGPGIDAIRGFLRRPRPDGILPPASPVEGHPSIAVTVHPLPRERMRYEPSPTF